MSVGDSDDGRRPRRYLDAEDVLDVMAHKAADRIAQLTVAQTLVLAMVAGGFITLGALFSVLLASGVEPLGAKLLLEGFGFSTGFFFVILAEAVLFTEANVVLPATLVERDVRAPTRRLLRFWVLAFAGNFAGALIVGWTVHAAQSYPAEVTATLEESVAKKTQYLHDGTVGAWFDAVLSGVMANWMVGMAAFFAVMGRTIVGKYIPILVAVSLFVAANFQHSPANMGYFSLITPGGGGAGWGDAIWWNIIPAGLGNIIGGTALVVLPFWYALRPHQRRAMRRSKEAR